ncbi:MAG: universal stress protein [Myxococcales bacterium]|nr:universal stress protein [Myxococcales bacterium]MCE7891860.1 universal stress protein [Sorangiineae bacterium PRO1]
MTTPKKPYLIVVGIDFAPSGNAALERAFELASAEENGEVHVIYVARGYGPLVHLDTGAEIVTATMDEASQKLKAYVEEKLAKFVEKRAAQELGTFSRAVTHIRLDAPAEEIAQLASDLEASLVVVGTHGRRGVRRLLLGSVAEGVVRLAPCAVLVVRPPEGGPVAQIEPPCPDCVRVRAETKGEDLWCPRHHEHHGRRHVYHYVGRLSGARERLPGLGGED